MPGSPAFYGYKNTNDTWEVLDNLIWTHGQHLVTVGGGLLWRSSNGYLTAGARRPVYVPQRSLISHWAIQVFISAAIDRTALPNLTQPNTNRTYRYGQDFLFAQDTYKLTQRLTVNYGVRYEFYGGPENTGSTKDALVQLGAGTHARAATGARVARAAERVRQ